MPHQAYIYDAIRTPRSKGKKDGSLHEVKPIALLAGLLQELQQRYDLDTSKVDDVVIGCVTTTGEQGGNIAKLAVEYAKWDKSVPGFQLNRFCASGLEAVNIAAQKVASGWDNLIVAGGVESMSRVPMGSDGGAYALDTEYMMSCGIAPQGIGADLIATIDGYLREDLDAFAIESQRRAYHAQCNGHFDRSVVPVRDLNGISILERDDFLRPDTTLDILSTLKPSFEAMGKAGFDQLVLSKYPHVKSINHVHTSGNSSGIVDGASAVLIGSETAGRELGLLPRGRIVCSVVLASEPLIMLTGSGPAAKKCLNKAGLDKGAIDMWEINEGFASVAMRYMRDMDIPHEITNVNGGAIALGHPLGATGGMLVGVVLDELERTGKKRAMLSLCVGCGMGMSTIIERV